MSAVKVPLRERLRWKLKQRIDPKLLASLVALQRRHRLQWPRMGTVRFGQLHRLTPISTIFGYERGQPIDRYYIESFLASHTACIRGRALELGDATYIHKFGQGVQRVDVLHVQEGNPVATIVADLTDAPQIPSNSFDCIIFTQSLQMIYEPAAALRTLHRILKPGGVLLVTSAGIAKIGRRLGRDGWGEYWHFTTQSMEAILNETFPGSAITVSSYGNVLSAISFLHGLASQELERRELDHRDPDFEVLVTAHVRKGPHE